MSVIGPQGKDLSVFVRFGGLNLKRQRGYSLWPEGACSPPARRGFYAAPKVAFDRFLIGGIHETQPSIFPAPARAPEVEHRTWEEVVASAEAADRHRKYLLSLIRREFRKLHGTVWSRLGGSVRRPEIIDAHGEWVKTTMREWRRAFGKEWHRARVMMVSSAYPGTARRDEVRSIRRATSYEVFLDEDV